jgi:hypothetical protein
VPCRQHGVNEKDRSAWGWARQLFREGLASAPHGPGGVLRDAARRLGGGHAAVAVLRFGGGEKFDLEILEEASARVRLQVQPDTWEVFRLTVLEGMTAADVARQVDKQLAAVFKSRNRVQKLLQEEIRRLEGDGSGATPVPRRSNCGACSRRNWTTPPTPR